MTLEQELELPILPIDESEGLRNDEVQEAV